jgi:hypothetical protein
MLQMLLSFAANNPGMTRVLIGDALVGEDERLQLRMNQFYDKVELAFKQSLRVAVTQGHGREDDVAARASLLVSYVTGRWHRFAKSGFKQQPAENSRRCSWRCCWPPERRHERHPGEIFALLDDASAGRRTPGALAPVPRPRRHPGLRAHRGLAAAAGRLQEALGAACTRCRC